MESGWASLVPLITIVGAITYAILSNYRKITAGAAHPAVQKMLEENLSTNQAVLAWLDSIQGRLQTLEKTLTDIPG